jgi:hypothetical protein
VKFHFAFSDLGAAKEKFGDRELRSACHLSATHQGDKFAASTSLTSI